MAAACPQAASATMTPADQTRSPEDRRRRSRSFRLDPRCMWFLHAGSHRVPWTFENSIGNPAGSGFGAPWAWRTRLAAGVRFATSPSLRRDRPPFRGGNRAVTVASRDHQINEYRCAEPRAVPHSQREPVTLSDAGPDATVA